MKKAWWFIVLSTVAISFGFWAATLRAQFAYVANGSGSISAYSIASNGALTPVAGSPFAAGINPRSVAVDPTGKFAYVVNLGNGPDGTVSAFSIVSNGALAPVPGSPFATGSGPLSVAVDPLGRFVFVANQVGSISLYSIASNGALTPVPGSPFATNPIAVSVAVDPTGNFAYVANGSMGPRNTVSAYSIGYGDLTPVTGSPFAAGIGLVSVAVDPTGNFAYAVNQLDNTVSAYNIGSNGALAPVAGSPFATGSHPTSVTVDPAGKFGYVTNQFDDTVSAYGIASNGALTPVPGSPFATGSAPLSVAVDPTGRFAYVANVGDNTASAYSIGSNGALIPVLGSPFATGSGPVSVATTPLVPFATSFVKLEIEARHRPGFKLKEFFALGTNSNGIDPATENVTLQIGTFSVTIPAGSFEQDFNGKFEFEGVINGVSLEAQIVPLGNNIFTFKAEGKGVDLTDLINPLTMVLTIGTDSGSTDVTAEFENRREYHKQEHARFSGDNEESGGYFQPNDLPMRDSTQS